MTEKTQEQVSQFTLQSWNRVDTRWMLSLYGTAIGAGVLFFPIQAGIGGLLPLLFIAIIAYPLTHYAHLALCRFVLSGPKIDQDITGVVTHYFGLSKGKLITALYFCSIYPILLAYSVAITNTVGNFMVYQLHLSAPPRVLLSFIVITILISTARFGAGLVVKVMSTLVYPFVLALMLFSVYLIPQWHMAIFSTAHHTFNMHCFLKTLWLAIPLMVFSFSHTPMISTFALAMKKNYGSKLAQEKSERILRYSHIMMVVSVMFFVFSCVLTLSQHDLVLAKQQNITILSYLADKLNLPLVTGIAPIIAIVAISKSFLGHFLGTKEGLIGILFNTNDMSTVPTNKMKNLNLLSDIVIFLTAWLVAYLNPSVIALMQILIGPIIAMILFIMPMYAFYRIPALKQYRQNRVSNCFVIVTGILAISAIIYSLFLL